MQMLTSFAAASRWQALPLSWRLLLALVAGGATPLALAPLNIWPLALIAPTLLAHLCWQQSRRISTLTHFSFGLGLYGVGVSWVFVSIHNFGNAPLLLAVLLTAIFVAFLAALFCLNGYVLSSRYLKTRSFGQYLLLYTGVWVLSEWMRSWLLTGFPWLYIGYSQLDTPLAGWAPVTGIFGVSLAMLLTGGGLLWAAQARHRFQQAMTVLLLATIWLGGALLKERQWTSPSSDPVEVALVQANIPQEKKWQPSFLAPTLERYRNLSDNAWDADWLIWPEAALPLLYHRATPFLEESHQQALNTGTALITGILYDDPFARKIHNSATGLGLATGLYHKTRLVPFGEYVPLEDWLRGMIEFFNLPTSIISAGIENQPGLQIGSQRLATAICYEIVYPDLVARNSVDRNVILTISNDAWFGASWGPLQHLQMAQMRALENGRYVIRGTNNGVSAIIDPQGRLQEESAQFVQTVVRGQVTPMSGETPFMRWGSQPLIVVVALLMAAFMTWNWRRHRAA